MSWLDSVAGGADAVAGAIGRGLAAVYVGYGVCFLLLGTLFVVHGLVLVYLLGALRRPGLRVPLVALLAEVLYGLMNPLVYLAVIERSAWVPRHWALSLAGSIMLLIVWACRLTLGFDAFRGSRVARLYVRGLAIGVLVCVSAFLLKDGVGVGLAEAPAYGAAQRSTVEWSIGMVGWAAGVVFALAALYLIPGMLAVSHLRSTASEAVWDRGSRFFLDLPGLRWAVIALLVTTIAVAEYRPGAARVELIVARHRDEILDAGRRHAIDPALIASIVDVTHSDLTTPFAGYLERTVMAAWLTDPKDNFALARPLDVSVGIAQIRPLTAMAALVITAASPVPGEENLVWSAASKHFKEYRGVPALGNRWRLPRGAVQVANSPFQEPLPKREVVEALFDDRRNLEMCALILALYAAQWEAANPAWSIRERPEILATLYQLGFEKSWPKADPRPNAFGERVGEVYRGAFIQRLFGAADTQAATPTR